MVTSYNFGHKIYSELIQVSEHKSISSPWRYVDTDELIKESPKRKCPRCDKEETVEGHDPCIANLPDVKYACCGHGIELGAYIKFVNDEVYNFSSTEQIYRFIEKYEVRKYGQLKVPNRKK